MSSEPASSASARPVQGRAGRGTRSRRLLRRAAIGICGGVLIGLLYAFLASLQGGHVKLGESGFLVYYSVSHVILQGHGSHIYDLPTMARVEHKPLSAMSPYLYPPYFALVVAPFSLLPYNIAYALWLLLSSIALGASLVMLQRYAGLEGEARVLLWIAALSSLAVFVALTQGQVSPFLLLLLTAAFLAARAGRDVAVGVLLGLTLIKPQYALAFLLVFLLRLRWRVLATFCITALALVLLPLPVLGFSADRGFIDTIRQSGSWHISGFSPQWNQCFTGFAKLLLSGTAGTALSLVLSLAALIVVGYVALRPIPIDVPFALATVAALLISPHTLLHDLALLLIPAAVALRLRFAGPPRLSGLLALTYVAVTIGFSVAHVIPIQLSVLAMCALGWWLWQAALEPREQGAVAVSRSAG